jgi:putative colanic acid biosynthesis acetyltransferase WcaF
MASDIRTKSWALFLRHLHLGIYNRVLTFFPSFAIRHLILRWLYRLKFGKSSAIEMGVRFYAPQKIEIGEYSIVHFDAFLDGRQYLEIGDSVDIGHQVNIFTLQHDIDDPQYKTEGGKVIIKDYAVIGGRSTILPNVTIGKGAVVASGSIVTKNVSDYTVVGGIPAKPIRKRNQNLNYKLTYRAWFQ